MPRSTKVYGHWQRHAGKTVLIDGMKCVIQVHVYLQRYPYADEVIQVDAVPVSKHSKAYLETKRELGDDWSTDVLASDVEVTANVELQCMKQPDLV